MVLALEKPPPPQIGSAANVAADFVLGDRIDRQ
jgi:hypothetical protein